MRLSELSKKEFSQTHSRDLLKGGEPLVVRFERIVSDVEVEGTLIVDALQTRAGTKVGIRQAPGIEGRDSLSQVVRGSDRVFASRPGDILSFVAAYVENGLAMVGKATAREHDGLVGRAQVMTAMARASMSRSTKKGAAQHLTITDGDKAIVASSIDEVVAHLRAAAAREWPGGNAGLIMRDRERNTIEFFLSKDYDESYLAEELEAHGTLANGKLELVPAWNVPMGRDQLLREIDPRKGETKSHSGPVTQLFEHESLRGKQGFVPCVIVACDEDEWAFGARTGRRHRVITGVQPIMGRVPVLASGVPSAVRGKERSNTILTLHDNAAMDRLAAQRASRRPEPAPEERTAALRNDTRDTDNDDREHGTTGGFSLRRR